MKPFNQAQSDADTRDMKRYIFITLVGLSLVLVGCEKPNPAPENMDPVYRDLLARKSAADSALNSGISDLKSAKENVKAAQPQTGELKRARREVEIAEKKISEAAQESKYLELLIKERKKWARKSYAKAFAEKIPWPPPEQGRAYDVNRRLRQAPLSWDAHLPKLPARLPAEERDKLAAIEAEKKSKPKPAGGH